MQIAGLQEIRRAECQMQNPVSPIRNTCKIIRHEEPFMAANALNNSPSSSYINKFSIHRLVYSIISYFLLL